MPETRGRLRWSRHHHELPAERACDGVGDTQPVAGGTEAGPGQPLRVAWDLRGHDPAEGAQARGEAGIRKLRSAANVAVYGGGVKEKAFLGELSDLIGTHWLDARQRSYGRQGRSVSVSTASQQRPIASVGDL